MSKWYRYHDKRVDVAICKLCGQKFVRADAEGAKQCPLCKNTGKQRDDIQEAIDRVSQR